MCLRFRQRNLLAVALSSNHNRDPRIQFHQAVDSREVESLRQQTQYLIETSNNCTIRNSYSHLGVPYMN